MHHDHHAETKRLPVDARLVALDDPTLLEATDAPRDRRGGERDALGKLHLAQPAVFEQSTENRAIERIQLDFRHFPARFPKIARNFSAILILRRRKSQHSY